MARERSTTDGTDGSAIEVERVDESVPVIDDSSSKKDLEEHLTFREDAKLHPTGKPKSPDDQPGGPAAIDPNRPPVASNRPDEPLITSLATGSGQHTPPDPATVDADGFVRPLKAEEQA